MIEFTRINNDVNGNPRYVCHYHNLLTEQELSASMWDYQGRAVSPTKYEVACKRANKIGGKKFNNKIYGGGIVFQSYNIKETEWYILEIVAKESGDNTFRIAELEEMKQEFILNESWIPEDQSPSWGDIAEVNAIAESKWNDTAEGKELKSLLSEQKIILNGTFRCPECHFTEKHLASCSHRKDV